MPAHRRTIRAALPLAAAALLVLPLAPAAQAASGTIGGQVNAGDPFPGAFRVTLFQANPGGTKPQRLGAALTRRGGSFTLAYRGATRVGVRYLVAARPGGGAEAGFRAPVSSLRLAATLGDRGVPRRVTINERTTVATAFALAQFFGARGIAGNNPGLRNAAAMTRNLVGRRGGGLSPVLRRFPNGGSTTTLRTFNSLANLVAACRRPDWRCARLLHYGAAPGSKRPAADTLNTMVSIATNPWHDVRGLIRLSHQVRPDYGPALTRKQRIPAWALALRFEGDGESLDGPGNIAIDGRGSLWVGNNYEYSRELRRPACGGEELLRFTPTGRNYPGSPYRGGGVVGVGFGIAIDPRNHVWVGNFGFAGKGCTREPPPGKSVSEFTPSGKPLSPPLEELPSEIPLKKSNRFKGGWEQGELSWPQATVSDRKGNIWIANCGNESVTKYPLGNPAAAVNIPSSATLLGRPFGIAVNGAEQVFVTGNESHSVAMLGPDGAPVREPIVGGGLHRPLGVAGDSRGYMWVANSTWVVAPCAGPIRPQGGPSGGGTVTLLEPDGDVARKQPFRGGGLVNPWGVAIDGDDTVWVANFGGRRVSHLCGTRTRLCPPGKRSVGASISPPRRGYGFDGLTRNTGVQVDPSGNVWLANNWKQKPIQTNPGGYQLVAYLGIAAPIKTPLIGPPEQP